MKEYLIIKDATKIIEQTIHAKTELINALDDTRMKVSTYLNIKSALRMIDRMQQEAHDIINRVEQ